MGVGVTIEIQSQRVLDSVLVTSILQGVNTRRMAGTEELTQYSSSLNMNGVMARPALV